MNEINGRILLERDGAIATITLNRPEVRNAIDQETIDALHTAIDTLAADDSLGAIVLTGAGDKAFAAGADIAQLRDRKRSDALRMINSTLFKKLEDFPAPTIAAVRGYALGGGCELAMACDTIVAADNAKFGQPEITIGTMPGMGGTQRLPRAIGKAKAIDWCLTGRMVDAVEAERAGLVARLVPADQVEDEALAMAAKIASFSLPVVRKIKEAINRAYESSLAEGLLFERREFHATFALDDQKEGMRAFVAKRKPVFRHR